MEMKNIIYFIIFFSISIHCCAQSAAFDSLAKRSDVLIRGKVIEDQPRMFTKDIGTWQGYCRIKISYAYRLNMDTPDKSYSINPGDTIDIWYETSEHRKTSSQKIKNDAELLFLLKQEENSEFKLTDKAMAIFKRSKVNLKKLCRSHYHWHTDTLGTYEKNKRFMNRFIKKRSILPGPPRKSFTYTYSETGVLRKKVINNYRKQASTIIVYDQSGKCTSSHTFKFPKGKF